MSARQAREVKRWKAMVRMYCRRDGTHPGPVIPLSLTFRNVYKAFGRDSASLLTPLLDRLNTAPIVRLEVSTAYRRFYTTQTGEEGA